MNMVVHGIIPSTPESEAGDFLWVRAQPCIDSSTQPELHGENLFVKKDYNNVGMWSKLATHFSESNGLNFLIFKCSDASLLARYFVFC